MQRVGGEKVREQKGNERTVVERWHYTSYKDNAFKCHTSTARRDLPLINFQRFLPLWKTVGGRSAYGNSSVVSKCSTLLKKKKKKSSAIASWAKLTWITTSICTINYNIIGNPSLGALNIPPAHDLHHQIGGLWEMFLKDTFWGVHFIYHF